MVSGWRRAFCTTIPKNNNKETKIGIEKEKQSNNSTLPSPKPSSKFGFFSNPSTPRLQLFSPSLRCRTTSLSTANSPKLQCQISTKNSPKLSQNSTPCSPKSPSSFSLLKNSLRFSKARCGICLQSVKTGQGKAIFTAECTHSFHFPCVSAHVREHKTLTCPVCNAHWNEEPLLTCTENKTSEDRDFVLKDVKTKPSDLKIYNDDEPLMSPTSGSRFNPIPESDENDESESNNKIEDSNNSSMDRQNVDVRLLPESAIVAASRTSETHAIVLKLKAPKTLSFRPPAVDLVTVIDVSEGTDGDKLKTMKRAIRVVISSLSSRDRLSIVAFSSCSKRLLPLRRMTSSGRRSAGKIVDVIRSSTSGGRGMSAGDAVRKAAKVVQDRREKNPVSLIVVLSSSDGRDCSSSSFFKVSSTRFPHLNIPVHAFRFNEMSACNDIGSTVEDSFRKCLKGLLGVAVQDLRIQLGFFPGSAPAEIAAVYSCMGRPAWIGSGSGVIGLGDFLADEERELLIEMKVSGSSYYSHGSRHVLSVQTYCKDTSTGGRGDMIRCKERAVLVPRPTPVRSSCSNESIERLRNLFINTRAVAESRRLTECNDYSGAQRLLTSARALLVQSRSNNEFFVNGLEAELAELSWRRQKGGRNDNNTERVGGEEKVEPLTPTSAWRAAERLAKVAIMRKSLNRVSDLHGFENARF